MALGTHVLILAVGYVAAAPYRIAYSFYNDTEWNPVVMLAEGDSSSSAKPHVHPLVHLDGGIRGAGQLTPSPDGSMLAYCTFCSSCKSPQWFLEIASLDTGHTRRVASMQGGAGMAGQPAWSPDGKSLAFVSEAREEEDGCWWNISMVNVTSTAIRTLDTVWVPGSVATTSMTGAECIRPTFSGAMSVVYAAWDYDDDDGRVFAFDLAANKRTSLYGNTSDAYFCRHSVTPDGEHIAMATNHDGDWFVEVLARDGGAVRRIVPLHGGLGVGQLQWRPTDGKPTQLAMVEYDYAASDGVLKTIDIGDSTVRSQLITKLNAGMLDGQPRWSSDGTQLAFVAFRGFDGNYVEIVDINADGSAAGKAYVVAPTNEGIDINRPFCWLPLSRVQGPVAI